MFEDLIQGPSRIQSLVLALRTMLGMDVLDIPNGYSNELQEVLQAMHLLSKPPWIVDIANRDNIALLADVIKYVALVTVHTHRHLTVTMKAASHRSCVLS